MLDPTRILSIQSHVVSGYVGNRAATFPLQTLGYDVDVINTVQFSNHTGYGYVNGHKTSAAELRAVFEGLFTNGLVGYARVLTGYVPGAEALGAVGEEVERMISEADENGDKVVYLLDPVMGDIGKGLYVHPDVVPVYKRMLRLASIITPNQFETELLAEVKITSLETLHTALRALHTTYGVPHVVLSSIPLPVSLLSALNVPGPPESYNRLLPSPPPGWYDAIPTIDADEEVLACFSSTFINGKLETHAFALPTIRGYFSGVGDLFSALVLAHFNPPPGIEKTPSSLPPLAYAVSRALLTVQQILLRTHIFSLEAASTSGTSGVNTPLSEANPHPDAVIPSDAELDAASPPNPRDPKRKARRMRLREMRVVPNRNLILDGGEAWGGVRIDWDAVAKRDN